MFEPASHSAGMAGNMRLWARLANGENSRRVWKWRPRRDSNPRPQDSYHFGFRRRLSQRSWSGLSLHPRSRSTRPLSVGAARPVSTPSPDFSGAWLGIGWPQARRELSPTLSGFSTAFPVVLPNFLGILCSILLSYVDLPAI